MSLLRKLSANTYQYRLRAGTYQQGFCHHAAILEICERYARCLKSNLERTVHTGRMLISALRLQIDPHSEFGVK